MALRPHRKQNIIRKQQMTPGVQTLVVGRMTDNRGASEMTPVGQKTAGLLKQCKEDFLSQHHPAEVRFGRGRKRER